MKRCVGEKASFIPVLSLDACGSPYDPTFCDGHVILAEAAPTRDGGKKTTSHLGIQISEDVKCVSVR